MVSICTTGALTGANARCAAVWCIAPSVASDGERVPDAKTLTRLSQPCDWTVLRAVLARVVGLGRAAAGGAGTAPAPGHDGGGKTNIPDPTDSTLLAGGARVLTRTVQQLGERVRNRTRSQAALPRRSSTVISAPESSWEPDDLGTERGRGGVEDVHV